MKHALRGPYEIRARLTGEVCYPQFSSQADEQSSMYDWNTAKVPKWRGAHRVQVVDETLRDGLQNATAVDPPLETKLEMLQLMQRIGVDVVSVGLPAASRRSLEDGVELVLAIRDQKLGLRPTGAARTVVSDVMGVAELQQRSGVEVEVYAFIGSSPIRHYAENWGIDFLRKHISESVAAATKEGVPFCLVTEDTTRARPDMLEQLFLAALDGGAARLCLCDTVGHATPDGMARLVRFTKDLLRANGHEHIGLDWHAHNDRGLALQTALWASEVGVDRIHGTCLGIGERVGNVPLELLVLNLGLLGAKPTPDEQALARYCHLTARSLEIGGMPDTHALYGKAGTVTTGRDSENGPAPAGGGSDGGGGHSSDGLGPGNNGSAPTQSPSVASARAPTSTGHASALAPLSMHVNGDLVNLAVQPSRTLLEVLRYDLDLYGSKQGCDKGDCGACTVRIDGFAELSCLTLALACQGRAIETVEALPGGDDLHPLLDAFDRTGAAQCGFCTPGFLMTAKALLEDNASASREEIITAISSNLCRCTGYRSIVDAIELAGKMMRGEEARMVDLPGRHNLPAPIDSPPIQDSRKPKPAEATKS
ncbi:MAG: 2Fe-2S iron-sulfur cluster-binding protein [Polyangiaceae bacterium]